MLTTNGWLLLFCGVGVLYAMGVVLSRLFETRWALSSTKTQPRTATTTTTTTTTTSLNAAKPSSSSTTTTAGLPKLTIFFGSQSGTAETFARELGTEAKLYGFQARVVDMQDYDTDQLADEPYAVFLVSTFGEGEPPDNAATFCEWLAGEDRDKDQLSNVKFSVFALGNRQYEHFCKTGRDVDTHMQRLGATRVVELTEGDDDGSMEDDFNAWKKMFWSTSRAHFGLAPLSGAAADASALEADAARPFVSAFTVTWLPPSPAEEAKYIGGLDKLITDPKYRALVVPVSENRELRAYTDDGGSTRHIEFDLSTLRLPYLTADNCGVYPRNDYKLVAQIVRRLGLSPTALFSCRGNGSKKTFLPSVCSVQDLFLYYLDFLAMPRVTVLPILSRYTDNEKEKATLRFWATEGKDEYQQYQRTLLEVLDALPGVKPPLQDVVDWCPKLAPRFYTISSSSMLHPKQISLTVSLVTHVKPDGRTTQGICSSYLCGLRPGKDKACIFIRPSTFRFPRPKPSVASLTASSNTEAAAAAAMATFTPPPVIMFGPGTGIAPFRGFLQEAVAWRAKQTTTGALYLFFGCRDRAKDYIYRDELEQAEREGLVHLILAFSREAGDGKKVYVQDRLREHAAAMWSLVHEKRAHVFICGGTAMGRSVRAALVDMAIEHGQMSRTDADAYLKRLQVDKRFVQELWS